MIPKKNKIELDIDFWSFIHLVTTYPNIYLNKKGKIINRIVEEHGKCQNLTKLSKFVDINKITISEICKKIQETGHIVILKNGNCKSIVFNKKIKEEGKKIIENMLGK